MKKILIVLLTLGFLTTQVFAADQWSKIAPAANLSPSDLSSTLLTNNAALDRLLILGRVNCTVLANTSAAINVLAGTIAIPNAAGTVVRWRRNTATTAVTWANIDAGAEAASTQYYVYALADTDATTFTVQISASSSAPTGGTYYRKIGYFYNNASSNIVSVGNIKGGDVPNSIIVTGTSDITTTSTAYADMTNMVIYFVSSGRPVEVSFAAPFLADVSSGAVIRKIAIDIDGTDKIETRVGGYGGNTRIPASLVWKEDLSAGTHTIKIQWKTSSSTNYQYGATDGDRTLIVKEL